MLGSIGGRGGSLRKPTAPPPSLHSCCSERPRSHLLSAFPLALQIFMFLLQFSSKFQPPSLAIDAGTSSELGVPPSSPSPAPPIRPPFLKWTWWWLLRQARRVQLQGTGAWLPWLAAGRLWSALGISLTGEWLSGPGGGWERSLLPKQLDRGTPPPFPSSLTEAPLPPSQAA